MATNRIGNVTFTTTAWTIANLIKIIKAEGGEIPESYAVGLGWTVPEIRCAAKAGTIRRAGNQMGANTYFYLTA